MMREMEERTFSDSQWIAQHLNEGETSTENPQTLSDWTA